MLCCAVLGIALLLDSFAYGVNTSFWIGQAYWSHREVAEKEHHDEEEVPGRNIARNCSWVSSRSQN